MIRVADVCRALRHDKHPKSGLVRDRRGVVYPREFWLADSGLWVRESGTYVTGYPIGGDGYKARRFKGFAAWRIRQAFKSRLALEAAARFRARPAL